jgi:hypothetical protein
MWREIRDPSTGKLLFRLDGERKLVEIVDRGISFLVDIESMLGETPIDNCREGVMIISEF